MKSRTQIEGLGTDRVTVRGALDIDSVPDIFKQSLQMRECLPELIDLEEVDTIDSAGLALLTEWQQWAKVRETELSFAGAPAGLCMIANLSGADRLLRLKDNPCG